MSNDVVFKGNWFYSHCLLRINYTMYDLRHETDIVNSRTDHRDIMLLAEDSGTSSHPFCYARVLGVYHANVIFTGPESKDYQSRCLDFLWVCWFELLTAPAGWDQCSLDKGKFIPMHQEDAFGFVDPANVLRCCHLIPAFADGKQHSDGIALSRNSRDADDWKYYHVNRYVNLFSFDSP